MSKGLIILGAIIILVGLIWPWLSRLGIGNLPGDIRIKRDGYEFYFPVMSSIIASVVLSLLVWLFRR